MNPKAREIIERFLFLYSPKTPGYSTMGETLEQILKEYGEAMIGEMGREPRDSYNMHTQGLVDMWNRINESLTRFNTW